MITPPCPICVDLMQRGYPGDEECPLHPQATAFWRDRLRRAGRADSEEGQVPDGRAPG